MTSDRQPAAERLDAYLDGAMSEVDRAAFEAEVAADPDLKTAVDQQSRIDESLKRLFAPGACRVDLGAAVEPDEPPASTLTFRDAPAPPATSAAIRLRPRRLAYFAAAASIAISALAVWHVVGLFTESGDSYVAEPARTFDELFEEAVATNFDPDWVCADDAEFAGTFEKRFHQPLLLRDDLPAGVAATGLGYCTSLSEGTMCLLATVDDSGALVFIDRLERDTTPQPNRTANGRFVHRRRLGRVVMYEVSPFPEPRLLPHFYDPESPESGGAGS